MASQSPDSSVLLTIIVRILRAIADLPRPVRRLIAFAMDAGICVLSVWLAFSIRIGQWPPAEQSVLVVIVVTLFCWFAVAWSAGIYRAIIRSTGGRTIADIAFACFMLVICPLLSGPKLMIFWITKETWNAEQEASPGRDYRQAA
jgi:hypothetical protein